MDGLQNMLPNR